MEYYSPQRHEKLDIEFLLEQVLSGFHKVLTVPWIFLTVPEYKDYDYRMKNNNAQKSSNKNDTTAELFSTKKMFSYILS